MYVRGGTQMEEKQNSNVIVLQDGEEKRVHTLTWKSYIKGICNYKWWVIGATALTGFAGFAGVKWGVNSLRETLTVSYSYNLATEESDDKTQRFVNGQIFDYSSVVSKEAFEYVKASDEAFASLDIDALYNKGAINVIRNINADYENEITYTLSAKVKTFKDVEVGRKFMMGLIKYPLNQSSKAIDAYKVTSYFGEDFETSSYLNKVEAIKKQYNEVDSTYQNLKGKFGANAAINKEGKTLTQTISDFASKNAEAPFLADRLYSNYFVDYVEGKEGERIAELTAEAETMIVTIGNKKEQKQTKLDLLNSMQSATIVSTLTNESEYVRAMISLKNEIETLSDEITSLGRSLNWAGYIENVDGNYIEDPSDDYSVRYKLAHTGTLTDWVAANAAFKTTIKNSVEKLESEIENATNIFHYVYENNNSIIVWNSGNVDVAKSLPWALGLAAGLVLGFAVSSIIAGEVEGAKALKKEDK